MKPLILIVLPLLLPLLFTQQIIDYSLTQSIQKSLRDSNAKYNINILAQNIDDKYLTFPQACTLNKDLEIHEVIEYTTKNLINNGELINNFKSNMTSLLQLADKIKNVRQEIKYLQGNLPKNSQKNLDQILKTQEVQYIKQLEQNLQNLNNTIRQKVALLQQLILSQINRTTNNNVLNQVRLNFDYEAYEARLRFLQDIKRNNTNVPSDYNSQKQDKIQEYFKDIIFQNDNENQYLDLLNKLLNDYALISQLKLRISNELKKLQAKNYTIKNKLDCQKQITKPINRQNIDQIQSIMDNLKQLKTKENPNRQHCQGVTLKLQKQLKKVFKVYNYTYACHQGLPELYKQKKQIEDKIERLRDQLKKLEYENNFKKIQLFYSNLKQDKHILIQKITQFDINQYLINKSLLNEQIFNIKAKLKTIQSHLKNPQEGDIRPFDYQKIKQMVKDINQEQLKYCKLKKIYDDEYLKIQDEVKKYQHRTNNRLEMYREYIQKVDRLKEMEGELDEMRNWLLTAIA